MIELTRLNGEKMVINSDLIRYAESSPDTVITLVTGDKIVVAESTAELIERVTEFRSRLLQQAFPEGVPFEPSQGTTASAAIAVNAAAEAVPKANRQQNPDRWRRRREID